MKKNIFTLTIGIPAFNEQNNIAGLLKEILNQKQNSFKLTRILVYSDGSTDKTINEIKKVKSSIVRVIDNKTRRGQAFAQNQIIRHTHSDILVLLNADILLDTNTFIENLIRPVTKGTDLTSCSLRSLPPKSFFEAVVSLSIKIKNAVYEMHNAGVNIYTCHGAARAFSNKLYKKIKFKNSVGEDAYSFLYCMYHGYKYGYVKNTHIYIKSPFNIQDHQKQSLRFFTSQQMFDTEFGTQYVKEQYGLPLFLLLKSFVYHSIKYPVYSTVYFFVLIWMKIKSNFLKYNKDTWDISVSSKIISTQT